MNTCIARSTDMTGLVILVVIGLVFFGIIALCVGRRLRDAEHQYETRIVKLDNGKYQVEKFDYSSTDWMQAGFMCWEPVQANSCGGYYIDTIEEAREVKARLDKDIQEKYRCPKVVGVVD